MCDIYIGQPWKLIIAKYHTPLAGVDKLMRADIMLCESLMGLRPARVSKLPYQEPVSFLFEDSWTPQGAP